MRTTVSIEDTLLQKAREASIRRGCTLSEVVEDALRVVLVSQPKSMARIPVPRWTTCSGDGVRAGVDLNHSSALLEAMDEP
ncbi:MAG: antitoxin [Verrucomicrobiae bacterium]|nr:antitoxin [Verrucomicrobiae bacterium]